MKKLDKTSKKIIETFLDNLEGLPSSKQRHFLYRASLFDDGLKSLFSEKGTEITKKQFGLLNIAMQDYKKALQITKKRRDKRTPKKINDRQKIVQWKHHPNLCLYHSMLWTLEYANILKIKGIQKYFDFLKEKAEEIFDELFSLPHFLYFSPVFSTNTVFLSRNLGILDKEDNFISIFKEIFGKGIEGEKSFLKNKVYFSNFIYGLTHIVIGDTDFYQKSLNKEKYLWIENLFKKYSDKIYKFLSLDINAEVALCLNFFGVSRTGFQERVDERLLKNFNEKKGYIEREEDSNFSFAEHTNAVALLLWNLK